MSRIFISHSSANNLQAVAIGAWLGSHADNGWEDYFLDLDPERGLKAGQRWQEALRIHGERCEAVIFLISKAWLKSKWCLVEFLQAKQLNKKIFGVKIEVVPIADIPVEMSAEWQLCNLASKGEMESIQCMFGEKPRTVEFSRDGLARLKHGLTQAGIDPRSFKFPSGRDPYRGLKPLEPEDAAIFFGRDTQILRALGRIRGMRNVGPEKLLVIVGASGSGKSSFLRAGLLPRLKRDDRNFLALTPIRPLGKSISGEQGLAATLESAFAVLKAPRSRGTLIEDLRGENGAFANAVVELRKIATARIVDMTMPVTVVLSIDQGEELLDGSDETNRLIDLLVETLNDKRLQSGGLIALVTIRSDRFEGLQRDTRLRRLTPMEFGLPPIAMTSYREIIERPAKVFDSSGGKLELEPSLVDAITDDAAKGGTDALPLLAYTLDRLYALYGKDGNLTLDEYDKLGRMEGAIAAAVEEAVPADERHKLRHAFIPHLAAVDPKTLKPRRKKAKLLSLPEAARPAIERMVASHLLISDKAGEDTIVELAHDSLLGAWDDLRGWLREDKDLLALRETVSEAAEAWETKGRSGDHLIHRGTTLRESEKLLARPDLMDDQCTNYLAACRKAERATKMISNGIWMMGGVTALALMLFGAEQYLNWRHKQPWGLLTNLSNGHAGELKGDLITVGRSAGSISNNIAVPDTQANAVISRMHLFLSRNREVLDARSLNGTTINAQFLQYGYARKLQDGDFITLGGTAIFKFRDISPPLVPLLSRDEPPSPPLPEGTWAFLIDGRSRAMIPLTRNENFVSADTHGVVRLDNEDAKQSLLYVKKPTDDNTDILIYSMSNRYYLTAQIKYEDRFYLSIKIARSKLDDDSQNLNEVLGGYRGGDYISKVTLCFKQTEELGNSEQILPNTNLNCDVGPLQIVRSMASG